MSQSVSSTVTTMQVGYYKLVNNF
uniref:Uncharacterized protein n=1 Tax=Heterorhabditis bacteriophora TaxID=37862 RepID=A0A1I7WS88_HETBA